MNALLVVRIQLRLWNSALNATKSSLGWGCLGKEDGSGGGIGQRSAGRLENACTQIKGTTMSSWILGQRVYVSALLVRTEENSFGPGDKIKRWERQPQCINGIVVGVRKGSNGTVRTSDVEMHYDREGSFPMVLVATSLQHIVKVLPEDITPLERGQLTLDLFAPEAPVEVNTNIPTSIEEAVSPIERGVSPLAKVIDRLVALGRITDASIEDACVLLRHHRVEDRVDEEIRYAAEGSEAVISAPAS